MVPIPTYNFDLFEAIANLHERLGAVKSSSLLSRDSTPTRQDYERKVEEVRVSKTYVKPFLDLQEENLYWKA